IAATLVELKTRRLLPGSDEVDLDEEFGVWEERDLLLARLLECKTFKDAAEVLDRLRATASQAYPRCSGPEERYLGLTPDLLAGLTPHRLRRAYLRVTRPRPEPRVSVDHLAPISVSVADALVEVLAAVRRDGRTSLRTLTAGLTERLEVIVRFLALLELYKEG